MLEVLLEAIVMVLLLNLHNATVSPLWLDGRVQTGPIW